MEKKRAVLIHSSKLADRGLVAVFTGDGKGKTSAALGVVLRALGHGLRVNIIYFMKSNRPNSERVILRQLPNLSLSSLGQSGFVDPVNIKAEAKEPAKKSLAKAHQVIHSGDYDVVVLDEINVAVAWKLVEVDEVIKLIKSKPREVELILTGRYADPGIIAVADLVTEMVNVKHPYDIGIRAREGIDY
jgi:cob(I)alamin adenosyltransferase